MAAPAGNQFWKVRAKHGRDKIFSTPDMLWDAACEYFQWVEDNPLKEEKIFQYQGGIVRDEVKKIRAMTLKGLYFFLGIHPSTWDEYKKREDFTDITRDIETIIYNQKLEGAAADLLNANIIARELGLKDATTSEHTGPNGGPQEHIVMDKEEYAKIRKGMMSKDDC